MKETFIAIGVIALIVGLAVWYIIKAKKSGKKCIGCPDGCCSKSADGSPCGCGCSGCGNAEH